jgi:predicted MFS family arabinose efflux permease
MAATAIRKHPSEMRNGLPTLLTAFVAIYWMNLLTYPMGVLVKPIEETWGWSRGETTLLTSFHALMTLVLGHWAGSVARRQGIFRTAFAGVMLSAVGLVCIGNSGPSLPLWYASWILFGFAQMFCTVIVWSYAVSQSFVKRRGIALALAMSGSALAASTFPPLTLWLYRSYGIGGTYVGFAVLVLVTSLPLMAFTARRFRPIEQVNSQEPGTEAWGLTLAQAVRTRPFWFMAVGMPIVAGAVSSIIIHYHSLMTDKGLSVEQATWVMSLLGPALLVGRLGTGLLLDRWSARQVVLVVFLFPAIACAILATFSGSVVLAVVAVLCTGIAAGAEGDMLAYFTSRFFGVRHYGQIYGLMLGLFSIGFGGFPPIVGFVFDSAGSYSLAFGFTGVMLLIGATLLYFVGAYPSETAVDP